MFQTLKIKIQELNRLIIIKLHYIITANMAKGEK